MAFTQKLVNKDPFEEEFEKKLPPEVHTHYAF
jgi:hypothetical protein